MAYILLSLILIVAIIIGGLTTETTEQVQRQINAAMLTHSSYLK